MWPFRPSRRREPPASASLGRSGERTARSVLKRAGLKVLVQNYRCPVGEADFIALDASTRRAQGAQTLVFVEVKTRSNDAYVDPRSAVTDDKRRRLRDIARYYLAFRSPNEYRVRFDIVEVVAAPGKELKTNHIVDAFPLTNS